MLKLSATAIFAKVLHEIAATQGQVVHPRSSSALPWEGHSWGEDQGAPGRALASVVTLAAGNR